MKTTEHIERLLNNGWKRKQLVEEMGFPRGEVLKVYRRLKKSKASKRVALNDQQETAVIAARAESPSSAEMTEQKLADLEASIRRLTGQVEGLETARTALGELEQRIAGTPDLGLKQRFTCQCGASGLVAVHVRCTKCLKESWWGWSPETK